MSTKTLKRFWFIPGVLMAAVIMLMVYFTQPVFRMTMDVNPSIEIVTNRLENVVEVNALNLDAEEMLEKFVLKERSLEKTLNDLVDLMILEGYIQGGDDNTVMISVEDDQADAEIVDRINLSIKAYLENKRIEATLLTGIIEDMDDELTGQQRVIQRMSEIGVNLSDEELEQLTLKELFEYSRTQNISEASLFRIIGDELTGRQTSQSGMITAEEAQNIALNRIPGEVIKIRLDDDEYEIKILHEGNKYEMEIDAYTGAVLKYEREDAKRAETNRTEITLEEARIIALNKVNGNIVDEEKDDDEYEFEIVLDGKKYEIEIDLYTGEIVEYEEETIRDDRRDSKKEKARKDKSEKKNRERTSLTLEEARAIALAKVNGTIVEEERDDDEFEFEIVLDGKEYEIEINAYTGKIEEFEVEDDD